MNISYIQKKTVDYDLVQQYFKESEKLNRWTNNGPVKFLLESKLHEILKPHVAFDFSVFCVSSGTAALQMAINAFPNKKLGISNFTFPSAIVNNGNENVRILPFTDNLTVEERCEGYILTNLFGLNIHKETDLEPTIIDNAASFLTPGLFKQNSIGIGSLHHTKPLGFGEGGFIVFPTNTDYNYYRLFNEYSNFGYSEHSEDWNSLASNYKMSDVQAAYILQHIKRYDIDKHKKVQKNMVDRLMSISGVSLFGFKYYTHDTFLSNLPILFNEPIEKSQFINRGVGCGKYYKPLINTGDQSEYYYERIINFPIRPDLTNYELDYMFKIIKSYS